MPPHRCPLIPLTRGRKALVPAPRSRLTPARQVNGGLLVTLRPRPAACIYSGAKPKEWPRNGRQHLLQLILMQYMVRGARAAFY